MSAIENDKEKIKYITQLADAAFNFYTIVTPTDLSKSLINNLNKLTIFLDTNFLFGILNLHYNSHVEVSLSLLEIITKYNLPFNLRFHEATNKEMQNVIFYYGEILRSRDWPCLLSKAASLSGHISSIEQKFHELNSVSKIDVEEFLRPYEHFDTLLLDRGIKIYRTNRQDNSIDLYHDYDTFLQNHGKGDKPYEAIMHDAKILDETRYLRSQSQTSLEAGALLITCDYYLYRFDWENSRDNHQKACVLLPNLFMQIIRPFIPTSQSIDKAFAETFSLPEFRAIGSGSAKACSKMLQILASYQNISESTAIRLLSNDLILENLRTDLPAPKIAEIVESAIIDDNKNLLEEKILLSEEISKQRTIIKEIEEQNQKSSILIKETEAINKEINNKFYAELQAKDKIQKELEINKLEKAKIEQERHEISNKNENLKIYLGFLLGIIESFIFIYSSFYFNFEWLLNNKNKNLLFICISLAIIDMTVFVFSKKFRKYTGSITMLCTLISIIFGFLRV